MKEEKSPVQTLPKIRKKLTEHFHPEWIAETEYIADIFKDLKEKIGKEGSIFQPGCGCGYVLDALWEVGYRDLTGLDRNEVRSGYGGFDDKKRTFLDWNPKIKFIHSDIKDAIDKIPDYKYDVVLTHRFLYSFPDGNDWLFEKIASKTKRFLITEEGEEEALTPFWHHHKRNYKEVFEKYGFKQIFEEVNMFPFQNWEITTITMRVFKKL